MAARQIKVALLDRPLTPEELMDIASKYYHHILSFQAKGHPLIPLASTVSFASIYRNLETASNNGTLETYVVGQTIIGILGYTVSTPWWSDRKYLEEMCTFTIDDRFCGFGRIALQRLDELAIENDCAFIATGNALGGDSKMIENLYLRKGKFHYTYPGYIKIVQA